MNRSLDRLKTDRRRKAREETFAVQEPRAPEISWPDISQRIDAIIAGLPRHLRQPLIAHFYEGQSQESVAAQIGVSRQTVAYRIGKGVEQVRKVLHREGILAGGAALAGLMGDNLAQAAPGGVHAALSKMSLAGPDAFVATSVASSSNLLFAALLGGIVMKRVAVIVLAGLAVVTAAIIASRVQGPAPVTGDRAPQPQSVALAGAPPETQPAPEVESVLPPVPEMRRATPAADATEAPTEAVAKADTPDAPAITGVVRDTAGTPLNDARVIVIGGLDAATATDVTGRFEVAGLPDGRYDVDVTCLGYGNSQQRGVAPGDYLEFVLQQAATLTGIVVGADTGEPLPEFELGYYDGAAYPQVAVDIYPSLVSYSDANGEFEIGGLVGGLVTLVGTAPGYAKTTMIVWDLVPGTTTEGMVFALDRGRVVEGQVIGPDGMPVAGAQVVFGADLRPEKTPGITDDAGHFRLDNVLPIGGRITAHHPSYAPSSTDIPTGTDDVSNVILAMGAGGVLRGTVTLGDKPLANTGVEVKQDNFKWTSAQTGPDGTYTLAGIVPGDAEVHVEGPNGLSRIVRALVEEGNETIVDVAFSEDVGALEGILSVNGVPRGGSMALRILTDTGDQRLRARADETGYFLFPDVPAGPAVLAVELGGGDPGDLSHRFNKFVDVEILAGRVVHQDINLLQSCLISGTVSGERYNAYDRVYVLDGEMAIARPITLLGFLELSQHLVNQFTIGPDGTYAGAGLEPGIYTIVAASYVEESPEALAKMRVADPVVVELRSGDEMQVDFVLQ